MPINRRFHQSGLTLAMLLPWLVAVLGYALAAVVWVDSPHPPTRAEENEASPEMRTLRLALQKSHADNEALRKELDRLVDLAFGDDSGIAKAAAPQVKPSAKRLTTEQSASLVGGIQAAAARAAAGDPQAKQEVLASSMLLLRDGPNSFSTLADAYLGISDPKGKALLLPAMLFSGSPEAQKFIVDQLDTETDPHLKTILASQAAKYANPRIAKKLEDTFATSLEKADNPEVRRLLIQGLGKSNGRTAGDALMGAASDPDESVRLAAIDQLGGRPDGARRLRDLLASQQTEAVRQFAECRLLVAEQLRRPPQLNE